MRSGLLPGKRRRPDPANSAGLAATGELGAETRCFVLIKAYLCRRRLSHLTASPGHAGAGGARSRAISIRISWNLCRGTVTSAIWKVV